MNPYPYPQAHPYVLQHVANDYTMRNMAAFGGPLAQAYANVEDGPPRAALYELMLAHVMLHDMGTWSPDRVIDLNGLCLVH